MLLTSANVSKTIRVASVLLALGCRGQVEGLSGALALAREDLIARVGGAGVVVVAVVSRGDLHACGDLYYLLRRLGTADTTRTHLSIITDEDPTLVRRMLGGRRLPIEVKTVHTLAVVDSLFLFGSLGDSIDVLGVGIDEIRKDPSGVMLKVSGWAVRFRDRSRFTAVRP